MTRLPTTVPTSTRGCVRPSASSFSYCSLVIRSPSRTIDSPWRTVISTVGIAARARSRSSSVASWSMSSVGSMKSAARPPASVRWSAGKSAVMSSRTSALTSSRSSSTMRSWRMASSAAAAAPATRPHCATLSSATVARAAKPISGACSPSCAITSSPTSAPESRRSSTRVTARAFDSNSSSWSSRLSAGGFTCRVRGETSSAAASRASSVWLSESKVTSRGAPMSRVATSPTSRFSWPSVMFADRTRNRAAVTMAATIAARTSAALPGRPSISARVRGMNTVPIPRRGGAERPRSPRGRRPVPVSGG
jgi:hypothetical protein